MRPYFSVQQAVKFGISRFGYALSDVVKRQPARLDLVGRKPRGDADVGTGQVGQFVCVAQGAVKVEKVFCAKIVPSALR